MPAWAKSWSFAMGVGYILASVVLDWLSDIGVYRGLGVTPWEPASGLALALVYFLGWSALPYIVAAEAVILIFASKVGFPAIWFVFLTVLNSALIAGAGEMLRRLAGFEPRLVSVQAVLNLIVVAIVLSTLLSLTYIVALWFSGRIASDIALALAWRLLVGHLVGILVLGPLPMMLAAGWRPPKPTPVRVAQVLLMLLSVWVVFNYREATAYQLFYLLFLPVLWTALKDGIGGAVLMLNVAQIGVILGAQLRMGFVPGTGSLQALMIALALTALLVGAVVSDRQAAGQRLRDQHAALNRALRLRSAGETAAAISHQINQPITAISTYAMVAREALAANKFDLAKSTLEKLSEECDRAAAVARSIRDLVKQGSLQTERVNLQELADGLRRAHSIDCATHDIAFLVDVPGPAAVALADRIQLEQALDNLVTNSIESIRDAGFGSRIKISARADGGHTFIDVEDDGPGFAPGLDSLATTPFMTTKRNGSGLGLAIARSVAEAHGGSLAIIHRSSGACVRLRLPTTGRPHVETNLSH
jgi:two-component system sensor kinase FixL